MIHPTRHGGKAAPIVVLIYVQKSATCQELLNEFSRWAQAVADDDEPMIRRVAARLRREHRVSVCALAGPEGRGGRP